MLQKSAPCDYIRYLRFTTSYGYKIRIELNSVWYKYIYTALVLIFFRNCKFSILIFHTIMWSIFLKVIMFWFDEGRMCLELTVIDIWTAKSKYTNSISFHHWGGRDLWYGRPLDVRRKSDVVLVMNMLEIPFKWR